MYTRILNVPEKVIMDPVHGGIPTFKHELVVIDHPLVQRMRHLKQNDVVHLVFPGGVHTRYAHSLGVMHVASRCFESIVSSGIHQRKQRFHVNGRLDDDQWVAIEYFYLLFRIAALLHDCGHGPYSHEFEHSAALQRVFKEDGVFQAAWADLDWRQFFSTVPQKFSHDDQTVLISTKVLKDCQSTLNGLTEDDMSAAITIEGTDVVAVLDPGETSVSESFMNHATRMVTAFVPILTDVDRRKAAAGVKHILRSVLAGTVNADAMDWLLRDSYFTGSKYGVFNIDHLLDSLRLGISLRPGSKPPGQLGWVEVAIAEKGIGAVEDLAYSRLQLYKHVYSHKAVAGFKVLLSQAIEEVMEDKTNRREIAEAMIDPRKWATLHDTSLWSRFHDVASGDSDSASYDLIHRRKLCFLEEIINPERQTVDEAIYRWEAGDKSLRVLERSSPLRADPGEKSVGKIRVLCGEKDGTYQIRDLNKVSTLNRELLDLSITYLYGVKRGWGRSNESRVSGRKGFMIAGVGIPCCGKSSILRYVAGKLGGTYFREPEEAQWSEAIFERETVGYITALTWFRSIRVPHLYSAHSIREKGGLSVVDSYYDKLIHLYLGKEDLQWLMPSDDPYFKAYKQIAALDYESLPDVDLLIVFKVTEDVWRQLLKIRNRRLDRDEKFLKSFGSQEYFLDAADRISKERGVRVHVFNRDLREGENPTEEAAVSLIKQISQFLPPDLLRS